MTEWMSGEGPVETAGCVQDPPVERFHILIKPTGAACNLACKYCFYLDKAELYPNATMRMEFSTMELFYQQLMEAHPDPNIVISWQGGEPTLMGLDFFRRAVELREKYNRAGAQVSYSLQTNGILLNAEWCDFLRENNFLVGISIDGPEKFHDLYRYGRNKRGSWARVMRGIFLMHDHGVEFNTLTCVNSANVDYPLEIYRFLRDEAGSRHMQFIPIVEAVRDRDQPLGPTVSDMTVDPVGYGVFLNSIFDEWKARDVGTVDVQMFEATAASWLAGVETMCIFSRTCGNALVLEHNGDVYSCDHFVDKAHCLGNIRDTHIGDLVNSARQREFGNKKIKTLPRYCEECDVRSLCNGGCPKDRISLTPDGEHGLNYLCEGYRFFYRYTAAPMQHMVRLLSDGCRSREIMAAIAAPPLAMCGEGVSGGECALLDDRPLF